MSTVGEEGISLECGAGTIHLCNGDGEVDILSVHIWGDGSALIRSPGGHRLEVDVAEAGCVIATLRLAADELEKMLK